MKYKVFMKHAHEWCPFPLIALLRALTASAADFRKPPGNYITGPVAICLVWRQHGIYFEPIDHKCSCKGYAIVHLANSFRVNIIFLLLLLIVEKLIWCISEHAVLYGDKQKIIWGHCACFIIGVKPNHQKKGLMLQSFLFIGWFIWLSCWCINVLKQSVGTTVMPTIFSCQIHTVRGQEWV